MSCKLVLVEGLPGSGKTTNAKLIQTILQEKNLKTKLFLEGDVNHPADFEGVAYLEKEEYEDLKSKYPFFLDDRRVIKEATGVLVPYRKLYEVQASFPNELFELLGKKDIYELDFWKNQELTSRNWKRFAEAAAKDNEAVYIFECCFIQNPITIGMVKYGMPEEQVTEYVNDLAEIVAGLNPILIYIHQDDLEASFTKAVEERPKEWSLFFIDYYTSQGYGKVLGLHGFEGALKVLKARKEIENRIIGQLNLQKVILNNSNFDLNEMNCLLKEVLEKL